MRERVCNIQVFVPSIKSISSKYYNYYLHLCLPLIDCKPQEPVAVLTPILSLTIQSFPSIYFCKPTIFVCGSSNTFSLFDLIDFLHFRTNYVHAYSAPIKGCAHNQTSIFHNNQFSCTFVIPRGGMPLFHSIDGGPRLDRWFTTSRFVTPALSSDCLMVQKMWRAQLNFQMFR